MKSSSLTNATAEVFVSVICLSPNLSGIGINLLVSNPPRLTLYLPSISLKPIRLVGFLISHINFPRLSLPATTHFPSGLILPVVRPELPHNLAMGFSVVLSHKVTPA